MEIDSVGDTRTRKRSRRPPSKSNNLAPAQKTKVPVQDQKIRAAQSLLAEEEVTSSELPRCGNKTVSSMSCARCRVYNWKGTKYAKPSDSETICASPIQRHNKNVLPQSDEAFSWNLSLAERSKRDSRSSLPTSKPKPSATRRIAKTSSFRDTYINSHRSIPRTLSIHVGPSTSDVTVKPGCRSADVEPSGALARGRERLRKGDMVVVDNLQQGPKDSGQEKNLGVRRIVEERCLEQTDPSRLPNDGKGTHACSVKSRSSEKNQQPVKNACPTTLVANSDCSGKGESVGSMVKKDNSLVHAVEEHAEEAEAARQSMEETMKSENLDPVELIVAGAIRSDPIGFVRSLRDAKLLRSLEKIAQHRKAVISSEDARSLRKQRKKEKKREKKEKKKQKRLRKLAANYGLSVEQLELEMSMDRSDSRGSAPRSSPLSTNGSMFGSSGAAQSMLASTALSHLPGPSPSSYLSVFPRPSFVPDPLNPLRNLAADRTYCNETGAASSDSFNSLLLHPQSAPAQISASSPHDHESLQVLQSGSAQFSVASPKVHEKQLLESSVKDCSPHRAALHRSPQQRADYFLRMAKVAGETSGSTPEDEEDEQNAIAISHLFPQLDAYMQLRLIQMCTDSETLETHNDSVMDAMLESRSTPSSKVARTIALIRGKVKEFKETNGMRLINEEHRKQKQQEYDRVEAPPTQVSGDANVRNVEINEPPLAEAEDNAAYKNMEAVNSAEECLVEKAQANSISDELLHETASERSRCDERADAAPALAPTQPCTSAQHTVMEPLSGMAEMGFGLQPRLLSILDEPLATVALDHPQHRTPAAVISEMAVMEDEEHFYTAEVKAVTDWFNHAPYGAGKDAHIKYWENVKQRVLVADWVKKLNGHRPERLVNYARSRLLKKTFESVAVTPRRSKSAEPWWPRRLFEQYEGALDIAAKVMRNAESPTGAIGCCVPSLNGAPIKLVRLPDDDTAYLAYFRPDSPLSVSDPTDGYQNQMLPNNLDSATAKDIVNQIGDDKDDEKARYLPWMKVTRTTPESSLCSATRLQSNILNKSTSVGTQPFGTSPKPPTSNCLGNANVDFSGRNAVTVLPSYNLFPETAYSSEQSLCGNALQPPAANFQTAMPVLSQQAMPTSLPPLSTVLDGLQPSTSGLSYIHTTHQASYRSATEITSSPHSFCGHVNQLACDSQEPSTSHMFYGEHFAPNYRGNRLEQPDLNHGLNASVMQSNFANSQSTGLTKETIVDQEMEDFFTAVYNECERSDGRVDPIYLDEEVDPFLVMDQLA